VPSHGKEKFVSKRYSEDKATGQIKSRYVSRKANDAPAAQALKISALHHMLLTDQVKKPPTKKQRAAKQDRKQHMAVLRGNTVKMVNAELEMLMKKEQPRENAA